MANMREIKTRMKSIKETKQITKAMKLISAAKLKKARKQLEDTLPFFDRVKETMADIMLHSGDIDESIFFDLRRANPINKRGYLVLSGDKGLAGGYNNNIYKLTEKHVGDKKDSSLMVAGHMGRTYFERQKFNVNKEFDFPVQSPTVLRARRIAETVISQYKKGEIDEVYIVFTMMYSSLKLEPQVMKLLPLDLTALKDELKTKDTSKIRIDEKFNYEPSPMAVFDSLIPKYVKGIIYAGLVEAYVSELSSRMTAMDSATANAEDMLKNLNLFYNRARQAAITQEISEIVGGAEVLN